MSEEASECESALSLQSLTAAQQLSDENDLIELKRSFSIVSSKCTSSVSTDKHSSDSYNLKSIEPSHLDYKSGAVYDGKVKDFLKFGQGVFVWPNGDKYIGEFKLNHRHGFGTQTWNDGSFYEGHFLEDKRSGQGLHQWSNGENFDGSWFLDYRHGYGKYQWHETSNIYEGMFFMNHREGYGTLKYASGDLFIGLYKKDNRYGPGILKYPNETEDVGYWNGDKLVRLLVSQSSKFTFDGLEPIDKQVILNSWYDRENLLFDTLNPQNLFLNRLKSSRSNQFIKDDPYVDKVLKNKTIFYDEFIKLFHTFMRIDNVDVEEFKKKMTFKVENMTPHLMEIFKHFQRFSYFYQKMQAVIDFNIDGFQNCDRDLYLPPGFLETNSINFLNACNERNLDKVKMLRPYVDIDVCDNEGYSPLMIAVLNCDSKIINYLLDNGSNINHLLDNGLSALMICVIRYYVSDKFLPNSAIKHQDLSITKKLTPNSIVEIEDQSQALLNHDQKDKKTKLTNTNNKKRKKQDTSHRSRGGSAKRVVTSPSKRRDLIDPALLADSKEWPKTEFNSGRTLLRFKIDVDDDLVNKYADLMSKNEKIDPILDDVEDTGSIINKKRQLKFLNDMSQILELLIRRGANPSLSCIPYPALCFAVSAGDLKIVKLLIEKGVDVNRPMPKKYNSLTPLCLACGVVGEIGPQLVKLLLDSLADPNYTADVGEEYLSMCEEGWSNEKISEELEGLVVGRSPLHIACARNDLYAVKVIKLLLEHSANPNLVCNGQTALSLAIAAGNKESVDLLLKCSLCDANMPLTNGVGSALCVISSTLYEHKWTPTERIRLIDKLIHFGADILQPIAFGPKRSTGTVIDYAYYMYNPDVKLAQTPYHSLSINERNIHNARRELLEHLGKRFREKAAERSSFIESGIDFNFNNKRTWGPAIRRRNDETPMSEIDAQSRSDNLKKQAKWCYNCGRTVGVKLMPCSRCKKVYFCSNSCKQKSWLDVHKNECVLTDTHGKSTLKPKPSETLAIVEVKPTEIELKPSTASTSNETKASTPKNEPSLYYHKACNDLPVPYKFSETDPPPLLYQYIKNSDNTESSNVSDILRRSISQIASPYCFSPARTVKISFFEHQFKQSACVKNVDKNLRKRAVSSMSTIHLETGGRPKTGLTNNLMRTSLDDLTSQSLINKKKHPHDAGKQNFLGNNQKTMFGKNGTNFKNNNINANNKGLKNINHKQLMLNANKRMLNRNQFVQNTKITINPIFGLPDNYSFN